MKADFFTPDGRQFLELLAGHGVRYVLVGGVAVIYHGYARLTGDVDIFYDAGPENTKRLWRALVEFWDGEVPGIQHADELEEPGVIVQFGLTPNRIDLLSVLADVPFEEAWRDRVVEQLELADRDVPLFIVDLATLIRSKMAAGRPKDLDDLANLPSVGSAGDDDGA